MGAPIRPGARTLRRTTIREDPKGRKVVEQARLSKPERLGISPEEFNRTINAIKRNKVSDSALDKLKIPDDYDLREAIRGTAEQINGGHVIMGSWPVQKLAGAMKTGAIIVSAAGAMQIPALIREYKANYRLAQTVSAGTTPSVPTIVSHTLKEHQTVIDVPSASIEGIKQYMSPSGPGGAALMGALAFTVSLAALKRYISTRLIERRVVKKFEKAKASRSVERTTTEEDLDEDE